MSYWQDTPAADLPLWQHVPDYPQDAERFSAQTTSVRIDGYSRPAATPRAVGAANHLDLLAHGIGRAVAKARRGNNA